jgi:cytochrome c oxidase assembly factor CtaG
MSHLLQHWSFNALGVCALLLALWHELGLRRLLRRTRRDRIRARRLRSLWFYGGVAVLAIGVCSPLEYWGYDYFYLHTVQHLLLMFAAPTLIVAGAPWQPLLLAAPLRLRRPALRALIHAAWARPLRVARRSLMRPLVVVVAFNLVMVGWHVPSVFDLAERNGFVHVWLMNGSMLVTGVLFWLLIVASPPLRTRVSPGGQAVALLTTNTVMWVLAMTMTFFTHDSWYSVYNHIPGVSLSPLGDQQLGAGILWMCGDLWAVPALIVAVRRLIAQEASVVDSALERILGGGAPNQSSSF